MELVIIEKRKNASKPITSVTNAKENCECWFSTSNSSGQKQ
jgi:hypothetical protein